MKVDKVEEQTKTNWVQNWKEVLWNGSLLSEDEFLWPRRLLTVSWRDKSDSTPVQWMGPQTMLTGLTHRMDIWKGYFFSTLSSQNVDETKTFISSEICETSF